MVHLLQGSWKLEYFIDIAGENRTKYTDILIVSGSYYSDFQAQKDNSNVLSHVGKIKVRDDVVTFQIQLSTDPECIGRVAMGNFKLTGDSLQITFSSGQLPGIWHYQRLF